MVEVIAELDIDGMAWPYLYRFAEQNQRSLISFPPLLISPYRIVYLFIYFISARIVKDTEFTPLVYVPLNPI